MVVSLDPADFRFRLMQWKWASNATSARHCELPLSAVMRICEGLRYFWFNKQAAGFLEARLR